MALASSRAAQAAGSALASLARHSVRVVPRSSVPVTRACTRRQPLPPAAAALSSTAANTGGYHPECGYPGTMEGITYL